MVNDWSELIRNLTNLSITFGVIFSYLQIKKISKTIDVGQKANFINVLHFFSGEYDSIICESPRCRTSKKVELWYFRFWNLLTNEYLFFRHGLLDDYIFEFWCFKICAEYGQKPKHIPLKHIETFKASHIGYLKSHNGGHMHSQNYFQELIGISEECKGDEEEMRTRVHELVKRYKKLK